MKTNDDTTKRHFLDLADKAYTRNICTFSSFLGLAELNDFYEIASDTAFAGYELYGGAAFCERLVVRFGTTSLPFPIDCLHISPALKKFSDELSHRDFLGALLNLGIKREMIGDILLSDNEAYVFCLHSVSDFILSNLDRIKHTTVKVSFAAEPPKQAFLRIIDREINVASLRLDAVIGEVAGLSRSQAQEAIRSKKVFVNGKLTENNSYQVKPEELITLRGFGRFRLTDNIRTTKKGRFHITLQIYA